MILRGFLATVLLACICSDINGTERDDTLSKAMAAQLACYPLELLDFREQKPLIAQKDLCLSTIYHETGGQPLWVTSSGPIEQAIIVLEYLVHSIEEGLNPHDYETHLLQKLWQSKKPEDLARLDTLITYNLVKYIHDMSHGQIKFHSSNPDLFAEAGNENFNPLDAIETVLSIADIRNYLNSLAPQHSHYMSLKKALAHYRELGAKHRLKKIPGGPLIHPGDSDERLQAIQNQLIIRGDIGPDNDITTVYNTTIVEAVRSFQSRFGLKPDGIIGPKTVAAFNTPFEDLITAIRVNMARWRWHDHDLGDDYIMVNIAGFSLQAVREKRVVLDMPVIVGKLQHQTPVFSDSIKYLDFNPFWNVPTSIAVKEKLPALRDNPNHLVERNIRLFSSWDADSAELDSTLIDWNSVTPSQMSKYKLRQDPGPWNVLGKVKFVFPNRYSVYLHDTPVQGLFEHNARSYSHGCIRVSKPLELASFFLHYQDAGWTAKTIAHIAAEQERKILRVTPSLPIHITYQTVWVDKDNSVNFNGDIYGRDAQLIEVLLN